MSREPSYYEIALTQRQVVIAFVILLVCLVTAFFTGLWVGSGAQVRAGAGGGPVEGESRVAAGDEGAGDTGLPEARPGPLTGGPGDSPANAREADGDGVERLRFFSEDAGGSAENPAEAPADGSDAGSEDGSAGDQPDRQPQRAAAEPEPQTRPTATDSPLPPGRTRIESPVPPPPEPPVTVDPRDTEPGGDGPVIQVFASHNQAQAQEVLDRLLRADLDAYLAPAVVDGVTQYRVRLGPFRSRQQAEEVAAQLRDDLKLETWITRP